MPSPRVRGCAPAGTATGTSCSRPCWRTPIRRSVLHQRTLGPILPVVRVADAEQAIALANDPFAPCASVWTAADVAARLTAGRIAINDVSVHPAAAFACNTLSYKGCGRIGPARG